MPNFCRISTSWTFQCVVQIGEALGRPLLVEQVGEFGIGRGNAPGAAPPRFTVAAANTFQRNQFRRADHCSVSAKTDCFYKIVSGPDAAGGNEGHCIPGALSLQEIVHLGYGVLDGHRDVLLGNVGAAPVPP